MSEENVRKRFSIFKKKQTTPDEGSETFDESSFSFELKSNNLNTCIIEASATMKKGKNIGMPLPLKCTWYRATDEKEFVTIEGITGAFYQPNADDIGCKICVHAVPVSEVQEYTGMPAFSEVGPIQIDPEIQSQVQDYLAKNYATFVLNLNQADKGPGSFKSVHLVIENGTMSATNAENEQVFNFNLSLDEIKVIINYKSHSSFAICGKNFKYDFNATKSYERDLVTICIRMFTSKAQSTGSAEILLKNQQLSQRLFEANKNYEQCLITIKGLEEEAEIKLNELHYYQSHYHELEKDFKDLKESQQKVIQQNENYGSEMIFLRKDLMLYKEQCALLEKKVNDLLLEEEKSKLLLSNLHEELISLIKNMSCSTCKIDERLYMIIDSITGEKSTRQHSSKASSYFSQQEETQEASEKDKFEDIDYYKNQLKQLKEEFSEILNKSEAEKNFYKRKAESLATENDKLLSKLGKNPKDISEFAAEKTAFEEQKFKLIKEVEESKKRINELENMIKINKRKLDVEIERSFELRKIIQNKASNSNADYQRIVNSLTQTLTDRDEELRQQKKLNKDFMNRIAQLEALLSVMTDKS